MNWTSERINALILLWQQGHTMLKISRCFGVPRNAIAGIVFRLRQRGLIQYRITPGRAPQSKEEKARKQRERRIKRIEAALGITYKPKPRLKLIMPRTKPQPIVKRIPLDIAPPVTKGVTILARKHNECAFPIENKLFCGAPVCSVLDKTGNILPTSWCEYHWIVCHQKGKAA